MPDDDLRNEPNLESEIEASSPADDSSLQSIDQDNGAVIDEPELESHTDRSDSDDAVALSADQLSQAFAQLMEENEESDDEEEVSESEDDSADDDSEKATKPDDIEDTAVSPASILEAMLFVGHPENKPLTNRLLASLMRGVSPSEIDDLVVELNDKYSEDGTAYEIIPDDDGYQLALRSEFEPVRNLFYGRVKEAKLSQSAVDLLAVVAYNQPIDRKQIDELMGKPCGGVLNQLVRRELLSVEKTDDKPRRTLYQTTERFLDFFKIDSVDDLPRVDDL